MDSVDNSHVSEEPINISDMPNWAQAAFRDRKQLNNMPSKIYELSLFNRDNILVRVPTTQTGITDVAILTILEQIGRRKSAHGSFSHKILYLTQTEASVANVVRGISICFKDYDIKVGGLSESCDITVTTPQKWDSMIRKSNDHRMELKLLIIDDINFLNDDACGHCLEDTISRTFMQSKATNNVRIVGLSSFHLCPDIGDFLKVDPHKGYFDPEGIVIPDHDDLLYDLNQQLAVSKLADQLNSAVAIGTVLNAKQASLWVGCTYMYTRAMKNPSVFGLTTNNVKLEESRADLINRAATILEKNGLLKYDRKSGYFEVTNLGRIANFHCIANGTISKYNERLKPTMGDIELFQLISISEEFRCIAVSQDEKIEMGKLLDRIPFPIKEKIEEPSTKINFLIQAYISRLELTLTSDMKFIIQCAESLFRALFEIVLNRGWAELAEKALNLCKAVSKRVWKVQIPLRQFGNIPEHVLTELEKKDLAWERYYNLSLQEMGDFPFTPHLCNIVHKIIHNFPKLKLAAHVQPITHTALRVKLTITPDFAWDEKIHGFVEQFWVIVKDSASEYIIHHEYFRLNKQYIKEDHTINFILPIHEPFPPEYSVSVCVVSDEWFGSQTVLPLSLGHLILPEKYSLPTEPSDLQQLPVTALGNQSYEVLYPVLKHFNPVQTQVFEVMYKSDENVLVAAPSGSGKTTCAEFAILRNHQKLPHSGMRVVYVAPVDALAKEQYYDWEKKFGTGLKLRVVELTGEIAKDLQLLEKGQIIISTVAKWNALSLHWTGRQHVQQVSLFIIDGLHLIGGQDGHILEVVVSRMRSIDRVVENKIRMVAFSNTLASAKDLGEWIGAPSHGVFNLAPVVHPLHVEGILNVINFEARMRAMAKSTYISIAQQAKNRKPVIVFIPTREHIRPTAMDLITYSNVDSGEKPFLQRSMTELDPFINKTSDVILKATLCEGVGFLHEGMNRHDHDIVKQLFEAGWIQVCMLTSSMCWEVKLSAHIVVVMGTQCYDGLANSYLNYSPTDLLQMMGHAHASCLSVDNSSKCIMFCHESQMEYYRTILSGPFPLESVLQHSLHDHLLAEVVAGRINQMQDAVDYLSGSFMFCRLTNNPSYYGLQGNSPDTSGFLSELVENSMNDLKKRGCLTVASNGAIDFTGSGKIASDCFISSKTMSMFLSRLKRPAKLKGVLEMLSKSAEFSELPIRLGKEEEEIAWLFSHQKFSYGNFTTSQLKANCLLQAHFSRNLLCPSLALEQKYILMSAQKLLHALIILTSTILRSTNMPSIATILHQMVIQALFKDDSVLLQVPHLTDAVLSKCLERDILYFDDLSAVMEDREIVEALGISESQAHDIDEFFNYYCIRPEFLCEVEEINVDNDNIGVLLRFIGKKDREIVHAPFYPTEQREKWWIHLGEALSTSRDIVGIQIGEENSVVMSLSVPHFPGTYNYQLKFMCGSYMGFDHIRRFEIEVTISDICIRIGRLEQRFSIVD